MSDNRVFECDQCGQKNRVRLVARGVPHCASCGRPLPWLADATGAEFKAGVEESPLPVLVDFWAPWCGPCRVVSPLVEKLSSELAGRLKVVKVDTDQAPDLGARFGVRGIPTLILFQGGRELDRVTGALSAPALRKWVVSKLGPGDGNRG